MIWLREKNAPQLVTFERIIDDCHYKLVGPYLTVVGERKLDAVVANTFKKNTSKPDVSWQKYRDLLRNKAKKLPNNTVKSSVALCLPGDKQTLWVWGSHKDVNTPLSVV